MGDEPFAGWDRARFRRWFLDGLGSGDFSSMEITPEPSIAVQVRGIFRSNKAVREPMKDGLVSAVDDWAGRLHGHSALRDLALIASQIRASQAVATLARHIEGRYFSAAESAEILQARADIIAAIGGFAPSAAVCDSFTRLIDDDRFAENVAQLFIGLCRCAPQDFARFAGRFAAVVLDRPREFRADIIMAQVLRIVKPRLLGDSLGRLLEEGGGRFLPLLYEVPGFSVSIVNEGVAGDGRRVSADQFEIRYPDYTPYRLSVARDDSARIAALRLASLDRSRSRSMGALKDALQ